MNTAAASVMRASASGPPIRNRIRNTSAFLRKLSLNAEKNWVQNSGANRRVSSKEPDIDSASPFGDRSIYSRVCAAVEPPRPFMPHRDCGRLGDRARPDVEQLDANLIKEQIDYVRGTGAPA